MMRNTAGKMKKTRGNSIFTAACWAIVSARCPWLSSIFAESSLRLRDSPIPSRSPWSTWLRNSR